MTESWEPEYRHRMFAAIWHYVRLPGEMYKRFCHDRLGISCSSGSKLFVLAYQTWNWYVPVYPILCDFWQVFLVRLTLLDLDRHTWNIVYIVIFNTSLELVSKCLDINWWWDSLLTCIFYWRCLFLQIIVALALVAIAVAAPQAKPEPPKILRSEFDQQPEGAYVFRWIFFIS